MKTNHTYPKTKKKRVNLKFEDWVDWSENFDLLT